MQQFNIKRFSLTALLRRSFKHRSADPAEDSTSPSPSFGREPVTQSSPTPSFASVSDWESVVQPSLCLSLSFEDSSEVSCTPWFQGTTSTDDDLDFAPAQVHEVSRGSLTKEMSIAEMYSAYLKGEAIDKNEVYPCFASVIPTFGESIGMGSEIAKEPPCADTPATFRSDELANGGTVRRTMIGDEADNGSIVAEQNNVVALQIDATEVQVEINDVSASVLAEELGVKFSTRTDSGESEVKEKIQARDVHTMERAEIYLPEGKNGKKKWLAAAPEDEIERTEDVSQTVSTKEFVERIEIVNEVRTGGEGSRQGVDISSDNTTSPNETTSPAMTIEDVLLETRPIHGLSAEELRRIVRPIMSHSATNTPTSTLLSAEPAIAATPSELRRETDNKLSLPTEFKLQLLEVLNLEEEVTAIRAFYLNALKKFLGEQVESSEAQSSTPSPEWRKEFMERRLVAANAVRQFTRGIGEMIQCFTGASISYTPAPPSPPPPPPPPPPPSLIPSPRPRINPISATTKFSPKKKPTRRVLNSAPDQCDLAQEAARMAEIMKARKQRKLQEAVVRLRANVGCEQDGSGTGEEPKDGGFKVLHQDADKASANVAEKIEQARMERTSKVDSDVSFGRKLNLRSAFPAMTSSSANATNELDKIIKKFKVEGESHVPSGLLAASGTASPVETIESMSFSLEDEKREKKRAILREWKARRAAEAAVASAEAQNTGEDDEQNNNGGSVVILEDARAKMHVAEKIEQTRIPRMGRIDRNMTFGHKLNPRSALPAAPTSPTEAANELETAFKKFKVDSGSRKRSELQIRSVATSQKTAAVATVETISGAHASPEDGRLEKRRAAHREVMARRAADDAAVSTKVQCVRGSSRLPVLKMTPVDPKNKDENKSAPNTPNIPTWDPHVKNEVRPSDHPVTTGHSAETPAKAVIAASRHRQGRNSEADKENSTPTVKGTNLHMPAKRLPLRPIP